MNTTKYRILSVVVMLLFFGKALADGTTGITVNNVDVSAGSGTGWTFANNILTLSGGSAYTLSGSDANGNVNVQVSADCNVTLSNLTLSKSYFSISNGNKVKVILSGNNTLDGCEGYPGLEVPMNASLTIDADSKTASLSVGSNDDDCAGIGSKKDEISGTITIDGGIITVSGDYRRGAGIGGGQGGDGYSDESGASIGVKGQSGNITINGGIITTVSSQGAGIGGGLSAPSGNITINGGTINARSSQGDDIGNGNYMSWGNESKFIITGGNIVSLVTRSGIDYRLQAPVDANDKPVYRVTIPNLGKNAKVNFSTDMNGYGLNDIQSDDNGRVYLYLPDCTQTFAANGNPYKFTVAGGNTIATSDGLLLIGNSGWTTYYSDKPLDFTNTGLTAYTAINYIGGEVFITEHQRIPANTGILIKGAKGIYEETVGLFNGYLPTLLKGSLTSTDLSQNDDYGYANYYLNVDINPDATEQPDFVLVSDASTTLAPHKAWLSIPGSSVAPGKAAAKRLTFTIVDNGTTDDGGTTGIESVEKTGVRGKNGAVYSLSGQKVADSTANLKSGIYIINGKKIVIK